MKKVVLVFMMLNIVFGSSFICLKCDPDPAKNPCQITEVSWGLGN